MARAATIVQADGNQIRGAMIKFDMDGNLTVPDNWDIGVTAVTTDEGGTDVDASAAIATETTAVTNNQDLIEALVAELNSNLTGARATWTRNTPYEYIVTIECLSGVAWNVDLSSAVFAAQ